MVGGRVPHLGTRSQVTANVVYEGLGNRYRLHSEGVSFDEYCVARLADPNQEMEMGSGRPDNLPPSLFAFGN